MKGYPGKMLRQVQKVQAEMAKLQEELGRRTVEATAGGGAVRVVANGQQMLVAVEIRPEVLEAGDLEMLQDLVLAAANEALRKSQEMVASEMKRLAGGLPLPGL
ncbi:MAG: YbaB/EbfC family nucleoid-associated protein [Firmicutes bacterium]|nr:YbaB/EbfC family nucleoid-associated protein [Bacillota bacterium]